MKLTIDTKEDSKEEIQKVIELLNKILETTNSQTSQDNNYKDYDSGQPVFGSMFDTPMGDNNPDDNPKEEEKEEETVSIHELLTY